MFDVWSLALFVARDLNRLPHPNAAKSVNYCHHLIVTAEMEKLAWPAQARISATVGEGESIKTLMPVLSRNAVAAGWKLKPVKVFANELC